MAMSSLETQGEDTGQEQSEVGLLKTVNALKLAYPDSGITFETLSSFSLLPEEIREHVDTGQIHLIVTGIRGGFQEVYLGSNTVRILKAAGHIPVLVIPKEAKVKIPKRLGFVTDFTSAFTGAQLNYLHFFTTRHQSKLVVLHPDTPSEMNRLQQMHKRQLDLELALLQPEMQRIKEFENLTDTLQGALHQYAIDLLVVTRNEQYFPDSWLHQPVVKRMVFHTNVPLLILPHGEIAERAFRE